MTPKKPTRLDIALLQAVHTEIGNLKLRVHDEFDNETAESLMDRDQAIALAQFIIDNFTTADDIDLSQYASIDPGNTANSDMPWPYWGYQANSDCRNVQHDPEKSK